MTLLPPSTNRDYRGARLSAWALMLMGALTIAAGLVHYGLPDGGVGVIAGVDLTTRRETIVSMAAWIGAVQIPHGAAELLIGWRYRTLTPLFLLLIGLERGLMAMDGWLLKGARAAHHPPEHYASVVVAALSLVLLVLAVRPARGAA